MKRYAPWFGAVAILVVIFGTIYGVVQQAQRSAANMPQIQLAQDTAASLDKGRLPTSLVSGTVDIEHSLAPFVIIYDLQGRVVASSGELNGKAPVAPIGILRAARFTDFHAITWQPQNDVRIASVSVAANKYFVLSGRSLKQVEANETRAFELSFVGGLAALAVLGIVYIVRTRL